MNDYKIKLSGIQHGQNSFLFEIKDQFFESFILSEVKYTEIIATALIDKDNDKLTLSLKVEGKINKLLCDICTEEISVNIFAGTNVIIKTTNKNLTSTDEIFYIRSDENAIDLEQLIFELIILNLPKKRQHPLNDKGEITCDKEMLKLIEKYTVKQEKSSDPRWDALKDLTIK
jgi:uncharacterized protein